MFTEVCIIGENNLIILQMHSLTLTKYFSLLSRWFSSFPLYLLVASGLFLIFIDFLPYKYSFMFKMSLF